MAIVAGVGSLIANDILTDCSYTLFEGVVNTTVTSISAAGFGDGGYGDGGYGDGTGTVFGVSSTAAMYAGAQVILGLGSSDEEVVTIVEVEPGAFVCVPVNSHSVGETVVGATFPVQNTAGDPFYTQLEMLQYLSNAVNDFLLRCPLVYNVTDSISVEPTQQFAALPSDCMMPVRISAFGVGLRETSQANLDGYDFRWQEQYLAEPYCYYRDKIALQSFGIWPRAANDTPVEIVYQQRGPQLMGLADGFLLPDPFLPTIKARVLEFAYSKDGEQRSPALAQWWNSRYEMGCKISNVLLEVVNDPNMQ